MNEVNKDWKGYLSGGYEEERRQEKGEEGLGDQIDIQGQKGKVGPTETLRSARAADEERVRVKVKS